MSETTLRVLSAAETAHVLRLALGPITSWEFWLADLRRNRAGGFGGLILLPCGYIKDRCARPVYNIDDVKHFILAFRRIFPTARANVPPQVLTVAPSEHYICHWRRRKLEISSLLKSFAPPTRPIAGLQHYKPNVTQDLLKTARH